MRDDRLVILWLLLLGMLYLGIGCLNPELLNDSKEIVFVGEGDHWQVEMIVEDNRIKSSQSKSIATSLQITVNYLGNLSELSGLKTMSLGYLWLHEHAEIKYSNYGIRYVTYTGEDSQPVSVSKYYEDYFLIDDDRFEIGEYTYNILVSEEVFEQISQPGSVWVTIEWLDYEEDIKMSVR